MTANSHTIDRILEVLSQKGPCTQSQLVDELRVCRGTISRAVRNYREGDVGDRVGNIRLAGFKRLESGQMTPLFAIGDEPDFEPACERDRVALTRYLTALSAPRREREVPAMRSDARRELLQEIDASIARMAPRLAANMGNPFRTAMAQVASP